MKPDSKNSNKRNLMDEDAGTENGVSPSPKRQVIKKPTSSSFYRCYSHSEDSDIPPQELAFSIDHVLEGILSSLDKNSLLQCRQVSHRWRLVSSAMLKQTDVPISFTYNKSYKAYVISSADPGSREFIEPLDQSRLEDLTQFLKKSYAIRGLFTMDTFPCSTIVIRGGSPFNSQVRSFLDTYGKNIRNLYFDYTAEAPNIRGSHLIRKLNHVLRVQVPNLESFSFLMNCAKLHSDFSEKGFREGKRNTRLHTLTIGSIPRSVLKRIIRNCPNLKQMNVDLKDMHLLMGPTNQMYLLQQFRIDAPYPYSSKRVLRKLQQVEAAITLVPPENPPLKFTSVYINFSLIDLRWDSAEKRSCLVRVINKILNGSWDTLKSITFKNYDADYELSEIKWPPVLPKVHDLTLCPRDSCGLEIFPLDGTFEIQQAFPRLKEVIYDVTHGNIQNSRLKDFSNKLNLGPVLSVVRAKVNIRLEGITGDVGAAERLQVQDQYSNVLLSKLFPRAQLALNFQDH